MFQSGGNSNYEPKHAINYALTREISPLDTKYRKNANSQLELM
jgi:hypothetical protein